MKWTIQIFLAMSALVMCWIGLSSANDWPVEDKSLAIAEGKKIAFNRKLGNCLACHMIEDGEFPGNIGPPLVAMQQRFPDRAKLRAQIADATQFNPATRMPPFEKHGILTPEEVDKIVEYLYTL